MKPLSVSISLAILVGGLCGCSQSASPTSPAPQAALQPNPQPLYTLSGLVFSETSAGRVPIEGVVVSEANSGRRATTGKDGLYSLAGLYGPINNSVSATRWGIQAVTTQLLIAADTRLDIKVVELPSFTLSGVVFERTATGTAPIEGAEVYCDSCGAPDGHTFVHTDANGRYAFSYTYSGITPLFISKDGYGDPAGQPAGPIPGVSWRQPMVNGDTRFDIELVRR